MLLHMLNVRKFHGDEKWRCDVMQLWDKGVAVQWILEFLIRQAGRVYTCSRHFDEK